jgi:acetylornithine/succinyldiaminopimelate/putrescine aminotransferase
VPPDDYLVVGRFLTRRVTFIADEVERLRRTGKMFAIEHYGVDPDVTAWLAAPPIYGHLRLHGDTRSLTLPVGDHLSTFGGNLSVRGSLAHRAERPALRPVGTKALGARSRSLQTSR